MDFGRSGGCKQLSKDRANVTVVDIDDASKLVAELEGTGEKTSMVCDVSKPEQIEKVTERASKCRGQDTSDETVSRYWQRLDSVQMKCL